MRVGLRTYAILFAILVSSCLSTGNQTDIGDYMAVVRIVDGDTFRADDASEKGVNVRYAERFLKLERSARKNNRGLWNENHVAN